MTVRSAHISEPKRGETQNGDAVFVRRDDAGRVLLAVVDGLGHGPDAATASDAAVARLKDVAMTEGVGPMMHAVHDALRGTRGAAATLCVIGDDTLEACAVGNVELRACGTDVPLMLSPGILGVRVSRLHVSRSPARSGARIALFSDGIASAVRLDDLRHLPPDEACQAIFAKHRRYYDDATLLIADLER